MTRHYTDPLVTLYLGDCIEVLRDLEADSVDSIVTDPPYGLEFMGKEWDKFSPRTEPCCLGVKHLGSCDSTCEARCCVPVAQGSRLPASPDDSPRASDSGEAQSKAVASFSADGMGKGFRALPSYLGGLNPRCKVCGKSQRGGSPCKCERPQFTNEIRPRMLAFQEWCYAWATEALRVTKPGGYLLAFGGTRTHHRLACALEDAGWIIRDELDWIYASGFPKGKANLKPAHEPIVLARKPGPLRPLAIDECRIPSGGRPLIEADYKPTGNTAYQGRMDGSLQGGSRSAGDTTLGRWPSNILLSDPELFDEPNPAVVGSGATSLGAQAYPWSKHAEDASFAVGRDESVAYGDTGGYARYFLIPKADRAERERGLTGVNGARGNTHPTVKSLDLMRHLVRLVTPPGGVTLDPFLGSGTTALAASEEGFRCIGIEREAEYLEIAKGRLMATPMGLGLDVAAPSRKQPKPAPGYYPDPMTRKSPKGWSGRWAGDPDDEEPAA